MATEPDADARDDAPPEPRPESRPEPQRRRDGLVVGLLCMALLAGFLALHAAMDRVTPYTSEAAVQAPVVGIAPNVSGQIVEVGVRDNQPVRAGDLVFRIDPQLFEVAVREAEAQLENVLMQLGAGEVGLGAAEAQLVEARARLTDVEQQTARTEVLFARGFATAAARDDARAELTSARAAVTAAAAQLEEARQRLGPGGEDNPQVRAALAQRERAQIELIYTTVTAPIDGFVTNTVLSVGQFATAGRHKATLVDTESAWIVAQLPETALGNVRPDDPVEVVLDVAPGRILRGRVESIAWGVEPSLVPASAGELPRPDKRRVWLREAERIPVRIELDERHPDLPIRAGALANVVVYTDRAGLMASVGRAWIRLVALVRYVF